MNQHQAPIGTVATIGHPANKVLIAKGEGGWRYLHNGLLVNDEDFRAGWDDYVPEVEVVVPEGHKTFQVEVQRAISVTVDVTAASGEDAIDKVSMTGFPLPSTDAWEGLDSWTYVAILDGEEVARDES